MSNYVKIKGMRDGIIIKLDPEAEFSDIYNEICNKFRESANFYRDSSVIISFEGRELTEEEENQIVNGITLNCDLNILCIVGRYDELNQRFTRAKRAFDNSENFDDKHFYKGSIRAHEHLETDSSVIILGDVNPGACVTSKGNIVILGTLYGTAHAGAAGNTAAFVVTLDMKSARISIADVVSEVESRNSIFTKNKVIPRISYIDGREVVSEEITRELLNTISCQLAR